MHVRSGTCRDCGGREYLLLEQRSEYGGIRRRRTRMPSELIKELHDLSFEEKKKRYIEEVGKISNSAFVMLILWEDEKMEQLLHGSPDIMAAYPLTISFDDWWHEWANYVEIVEKVFKNA